MAQRVLLNNLFGLRSADEERITVFKSGTQDLATLYTDESGDHESPNPIDTDPLGSVAFWTDEDKVDVVYSVGVVGGPGASITRKDTYPVPWDGAAAPLRPESSGLRNPSAYTDPDGNPPGTVTDEKRAAVAKLAERDPAHFSEVVPAPTVVENPPREPEVFAHRGAPESPEAKPEFIDDRGNNVDASVGREDIGEYPDIRKPVNVPTSLLDSEPKETPDDNGSPADKPADEHLPDPADPAAEAKLQGLVGDLKSNDKADDDLPPSITGNNDPTKPAFGQGDAAEAAQTQPETDSGVPQGLAADLGKDADTEHPEQPYTGPITPG